MSKGRHPSKSHTPRFIERLRNYFFAGLLVLGPTVLTAWVFIRLINWVDNLLGRYFRFSALDYQRIPGIGVLATLVLLVLVGWMASWIGAGPLVRVWDRVLTRIPGIGILYGSTKSLGEAFLSNKQEVFRQVVLLPWPHPQIWRVGFITARADGDVEQRLGEDTEVVFVPSTPNPVSGFVHYVPKSRLIYLDWPVEEGLKFVISGGVVQPSTLATAREREPLPASGANQVSEG